MFLVAIEYHDLVDVVINLEADNSFEANIVFSMFHSIY
jgi:hypothetical protein